VQNQFVADILLFQHILLAVISFLDDTVKVRTTGQFGWQLATESDLEFGKKPRMWMVVSITTWHLDLCPVGLRDLENQDDGFNLYTAMIERLWDGSTNQPETTNYSMRYQCFQN
jgi:hypothetical protein